MNNWRAMNEWRTDRAEQIKQETQSRCLKINDGKAWCVMVNIGNTGVRSIYKFATSDEACKAAETIKRCLDPSIVSLCGYAVFPYDNVKGIPCMP